MAAKLIRRSRRALPTQIGGAGRRTQPGDEKGGPGRRWSDFRRDNHHLGWFGPLDSALPPSAVNDTDGPGSARPLRRSRSLPTFFNDLHDDLHDNAAAADLCDCCPDGGRRG